MIVRWLVTTCLLAVTTLPDDRTQPGVVYPFLYRALLMRHDQWRWWQ